MVARILIVDDEQQMRQLVHVYLRNEGYTLEEAGSGEEALQKIQNQSYDALVLDIMMPGMDGWEVCRQVRKGNTEPGILILTAKTEVTDRVKGLNLGADDYLIKPFAPEELVARVKALLRRSTPVGEDKPKDLIIEELCINIERHEVKVTNIPVELTAKEFDILLLMANHPKRVFTREQLIEQVWPINEWQDPRTIDTHIKNIRTKLKNNQLSFNPIKTVWGIGYKFNFPDGVKQ
ncbi:response regulator transcription factor [Salibacterium halotolerans]|uniref:Two-component system, OmpR family, response regulator ResD n=1 Tax=Salibacterium halotolerans TaxID=1884432 RepID=A0A1I5UQH5_9BACI|nr:response regulator transcription factor [Salibacterium halotolerans]SFP97479.1 two-component system, OmpR family, response regulator ResD [Salibacterium halotolerans]